jgi:hypothetical protein
MSGSFSRDKIHSGVAADAVFQEGRDTPGLLEMMTSLPQPTGGAQQPDRCAFARVGRKVPAHRRW